MMGSVVGPSPVGEGLGWGHTELRACRVLRMCRACASATERFGRNRFGGDASGAGRPTLAQIPPTFGHLTGAEGRGLQERAATIGVFAGKPNPHPTPSP